MIISCAPFPSYIELIPILRFLKSYLEHTVPRLIDLPSFHLAPWLPKCSVATHLLYGLHIRTNLDWCPLRWSKNATKYGIENWFTAIPRKVSFSHSSKRVLRCSMKLNVGELFEINFPPATFGIWTVFRQSSSKNIFTSLWILRYSEKRCATAHATKFLASTRH